MPSDDRGFADFSTSFYLVSLKDSWRRRCKAYFSNLVMVGNGSGKAGSNEVHHSCNRSHVIFCCGDKIYVWKKEGKNVNKTRTSIFDWLVNLLRRIKLCLEQD